MQHVLCHIYNSLNLKFFCFVLTSRIINEINKFLMKLCSFSSSSKVQYSFKI